MESTTLSPDVLAAFLTNPETQQLLAPVDFALRNGQHVQAEHPQQREWFAFITRHATVLNGYYLICFNLQLEERRDGMRRYFYLWQRPGTDSLIPDAYREPLEPAMVIVGMLLCKVSLMDVQRDEFASIEELLSFLHEEYEEYRDGLFLQLAHLSQEETMQRDEAKVVSLIKRSLKEFERLGWVYRTPDKGWRILPALNRIRELYEEEINSIKLRFTPRP